MSSSRTNSFDGLRHRIDVLISHRTTTGSRYIENFDGLRAVAALMVFALHLQSIPHVAVGPAGVWLFFTLSGYLLYAGFLNMKGTPNSANLVAYLVRRVFRIMPLYAVCVICIALLFRNWEPDVQHAWIVQHLLFVRADDHLWTTKTELVFYLFLPALVLLLYPLRSPALRATVLLTAAATAWYLFEHKAMLTLRGGSPQFAPFILGMAAVHMHGWIQPRLAPLLTASGAILIILFGTNFTWGQAVREWFGLYHPSQLWEFGHLFYIPCMLVVLGVSFSRSRFWANRWLRFVGVCGFGFYLWHLPIIIEVREWPITSPIYEVVCLALTVLVCGLTYVLVERPGMELGKRLSVWIKRDRYRWGLHVPSFAILFGIVVFMGYRATTIDVPDIRIRVEMWSQKDTHAKVYLSDHNEFTERIADRQAVPGGDWVKLEFGVRDLPLRRVRFDPGETDGEYRIRNISLHHPFSERSVPLDLTRFEPRLGIARLEYNGTELVLRAQPGHNDPVLITDQETGQPWLHSRTWTIAALALLTLGLLVAVSLGIDRLTRTTPHNP